MKIKFSGPALPRSGTLVLFLAEGKSLTGLADKADRACKGQIARALAAALGRIHANWASVRIDPLPPRAGATLPIGAQLRVDARVQLGSLTPNDVAVELYLGRVNAAGEIVGGEAIPMRPASLLEGGGQLFTVEAPCATSGLHGYAIRARPTHPDLAASFLPGLIVWAEGAG